MPELKLENSLVDERYQVRERLSRGSYAEIFVARDHLGGGGEVVLKALNTSLQGTPEAELERTLIENFQTEAIALDRVAHSHVIRRLGHGTAADLRGVPFHYLVLEYMSGGDLLNLCRSQRSGALPLARALFYFKQVCEALAHAHNQGLIHRDLKPNNLLLSADHLTLKIADFGVAKLAGLTPGEDDEITRVGAGIYAPPEHHPDLRGRSLRLTAAADIYSLAKSFYTVVCGRAPSQFGCRPISSLPENVLAEAWGAGLLRVLQRATAQEVAERYPSVTEFWSDLASVAALETETEEETHVRPRLQVAPAGVPTSPAQPAFNPVLASSGSVMAEPAGFAAAARMEPISLAPPPLAVGLAHKAKIVVELPTAARPPVQPISTLPPAAPPTTRANPQQPAAKARAAKPALAQTFASKFTESLRRRIFVGLLAAAFVVLLGSTYRFVRDNGASFGNGTPNRIEIVAPGLKVRAGPGTEFGALGVIGRSSNHRVLRVAENGWLQIEVGAWSPAEPHVDFTNQGWVSGHPDYVRVTERRWW